jgi:hypothetical protein
MGLEPGFIFALTILVVVTGIVTRMVIGTWFRRGEGGLSATGRLAKMEDRITRIEEATSGLVAEFAAVRERERFMTQLVESRARKDARAAAQIPSSSAPGSGSDEPSPFVVQTVSAVRRIVKPGPG